MESRAVQQWAMREVARQLASPIFVVGMLQAWNYARTQVPVNGITQFHLLTMSRYVRMLDYQPTWRTTAVSFRDGGTASEWWHIPRQMGLLCDAMQDGPSDEDEVHEWVKRFLEIHPFEDGNGRVGSILYNLLMGTMETPQMMPYYFGKEGQ